MTDDRRHISRDVVIMRILVGFVLSVILMVLGWIGINVADSRVDIARIQTQMMGYTTSTMYIQETLTTHSQLLSRINSDLTTLDAKVQFLGSLVNKHENHHNIKH